LSELSHSFAEYLEEVHGYYEWNEYMRISLVYIESWKENEGTGLWRSCN